MPNSEKLLKDLIDFSIWLDKHPGAMIEKKRIIPKIGDSFLTYHLKVLQEEINKEKEIEYSKGFSDGVENTRLGTTIE